MKANVGKVDKYFRLILVRGSHFGCRTRKFKLVGFAGSNSDSYRINEMVSALLFSERWNIDQMGKGQKRLNNPQGINFNN
jgi:hypothetical protein